MIEELFDSFDQLNTPLVNKINVISVKKSRIMFEMSTPNIVNIMDLRVLDSFCKDAKVGDIATFQDTLFISTEELKDDFFEKNSNNSLAKIYSLILELRSMLCTCPALEFQISENYIKIYIDVPNLYVKDLNRVDNYLKREGVIEVSNQRPYLLYVKDW